MGRPQGCLKHEFHDYIRKSFAPDESAPGVLPPPEGPEYDLCVCGHGRYMHSLPNYCVGEVLTPQGDDRNNCPCRTFAPAWMERLDPNCIRPTGCRSKLKRGCAHGCREAADELSRETRDAEPEAQECPHDSWEEYRGWRRCADCGHGWSAAWEPECETGDMRTCTTACPAHGMPEPEAPEEPNETLQRAAQRAREMIQRPLRRPPYAVAYAVQGGAQYEIALPGDATVRAVDGTLIVTHDSAVLALTNVRPMEDQ